MAGLDQRLLETQKAQSDQLIRQMVGTVTNDAPFTVAVRGVERTGLVYLGGYQPSIGDRVLIVQRGTEAPIVLGKISGEGAPVPLWGNIGAAEFFAHSGAVGGASAGDRGTDQRLGRLLGTDMLSRARGGSRLGWYEYASQEVGGWAHVYRYIAPPVVGGSSTNRYMLANRDLVVLWYGENDLPQFGPGASNLDPFLTALEACISRARAAMVFEEDNATVTYPTGTWSDAAAGEVAGGGNLLFASGGGYKYASSGSVRVITPADFQGGTVALAFLSAADGSGALFDLTLDGESVGTIDTRDRNAHDYGTPGDSGDNLGPIPVVKRFTDLDPGTHTIVATTSAGDLPIFDCWWIEADPPPIVVVAGLWDTDNGVPLFQFYDLAGFPYVPVAGDVDDTDDLMEAVCDTFDDDVLFVRVNEHLNREPRNFSVDHIHPSDRGHAIVAEQIALAVQNRARTRAAHSEGAGEAPGITRAPGWTDRNVIEAQQYDVVPLTLRGRKPGDHLAYLLSLDGSGQDFAVIGFARNADDQTDGRIALVDTDMSMRAEAGDASLVSGEDNTFTVGPDDSISEKPIGWDSGSHRITLDGAVFGAPGLSFDDDTFLWRVAAGALSVNPATLAVATPTADEHAATKEYVDDSVGGGGLLGTANTWTAKQTYDLASAGIWQDFKTGGTSKGTLSDFGGLLLLNAVAGMLISTTASDIQLVPGGNLLVSKKEVIDLGSAGTWLDFKTGGTSRGTLADFGSTLYMNAVVGMILGTSAGDVTFAPAGDIDAGSNRIKSVSDATAATDALNRQTGDGRYSPIAAWQLLAQTPTNYMILDSGAATWLFTETGTLGVNGFNVYTTPIFRIPIFAADFPAVTGKTLKVRIRGMVSSNGTDPNCDFTFALRPVTYAGGADALNATGGTAVGNTAVVSNANLGTNETEVAESTAFTLPSDGVYVISVANSATLANNAAVAISARLEFHYE